MQFIRVLFLSKISGPFWPLLSKSDRWQNFNFIQGLWKEVTGLTGNVLIKVIWGSADPLSVTTGTVMTQEGATKNNLDVWKAPCVFLVTKAGVLSDAEGLDKALAASWPQTLQQMLTRCRKPFRSEFWGCLGLQLKGWILSMQRKKKKIEKKRGQVMKLRKWSVIH